MIVHGVQIERYDLKAWEKHARSIEKDNEHIHPRLRILGMRWLGRTEGRKAASLVMDTDCAEAANRMIVESVIMAKEQKLVSKYDPRYRVIMLPMLEVWIYKHHMQINGEMR